MPTNEETEVTTVPYNCGDCGAEVADHAYGDLSMFDGWRNTHKIHLLCDSCYKTGDYASQGWDSDDGAGDC